MLTKSQLRAYGCSVPYNVAEYGEVVACPCDLSILIHITAGTMSEEGWVKIHRKIRESEMYQRMNPVQRSILFDVLLLVNWKAKEWDYKGEHYRIEPGQMVTSLAKLQEQCAPGVSIKNIRTTLQMMKNYGFLTNHSTKQNRVLTICNWDKYQTEAANEPANGVAKRRQRGGKEVATIEERKKGKKEEERIISPNGEKAVALSSGEEKWFSYWQEMMGFPITKDLARQKTRLKGLIEKHGTEKVKKAIEVAAFAKRQRGRAKPFWTQYLSGFIKLADQWDTIQAYAADKVAEELSYQQETDGFLI